MRGAAAVRGRQAAALQWRNYRAAEQAAHLFFEVKSGVTKCKSGTAFKRLLYLIQIHTLEDQKSSTGQIENSFDFDMKKLVWQN